jgi:hypothetical protein
MATKPGTGIGIEGLKAGGLGFGSFDEFVDVDVHPNTL